MTKMPDFKVFKQKALQNEQVRLEYENLRPEFELMQKVIKARQKLNSYKMGLIIWLCTCFGVIIG